MSRYSKGQRRLGVMFILIGGMALALMMAALFHSQMVAPGMPAGTVYASGDLNPIAVSSSAGEAPMGVSGTPSPLCRFGVTAQTDITLYDIASLRVGWYLDWGVTTTPPHPGGAEYFQVVRLSQTGDTFSFRPTIDTLYAAVDANPGAVWFIGNEQDRRVYQDDLPPEIYARAYHYLYGLIKGRDPSAKIGIGGVVQPTPLRFQYLDLVLDSYQQQYGTPMPVDIWNVHSFILREISPDHPLAGQPGYEVWGAGIPRGRQFDSIMQGVMISPSQFYDLALFRQRIVDFRQWMAAKGQRDRPLIVSEYGVLWPEDYYDENGQFLSVDREIVFMRGTFDFFRMYTDASIGYPADGNRLVQRWAWFSVDADPYWWGGTLFYTATHTLRPLGQNWLTYTSAISPVVDLVAVRVVADPAALSDIGQPQTTTLKALVSNAGDISVTRPITVAFYAGQPPSGTLIGSMQVITSWLNGCGATAEVSVTWPNLDTGAHPMYVQVDPGGAINEANRANNIAIGVVLVATQHIYLPLIIRTYPSQ